MGCRQRLRSAWPWAPNLAVALAVALAGCGGGKRAATTTIAPPPRIPAAVASDLLQRAESIATALDAGNGCGAQTRARALMQAVAAARRQIPARLRRPLSASAADLAARISCTPAPTPAPKPKPHGHPKPPKPHHDHGHHKKKGHR